MCRSSGICAVFLPVAILLYMTHANCDHVFYLRSPGRPPCRPSFLLTPLDVSCFRNPFEEKWEGYFTINPHAAKCIYLRYMRLGVAAARCLRGDASCRGCGLPILWRTLALWARRWQLESSKIVWRLSFSCLCLEVVHWFVECEQTATHKLDLHPREQSVSCSRCIGHLGHFAFSRSAGPYLQGLFSGGGWLVWRSSWRDWLLSTKALSFLHWQRRPTQQLHLLQVWRHVELSARPRVWPLTSFLACSPWIPSFCSHPKCAWSIVWIFLPWTGVVDLYALCLRPLFDYHVWPCRPRWGKDSALAMWNSL